MNNTTLDTILDKELTSINSGDQVSSLRHDLQEHGKKRISAMVVPSSALEDWKYTNLRALLPETLCPPSDKSEGIEPRAQISTCKERVVFINGTWVSAFGSLDASTQVQVLSSKDELPACFMKNRLEFMPNSNQAPRRSSQSSSPFAPLNDYLADQFVYVEVKEGTEVSLEITHIANPSKEGEIRSPRLFVSVAKGAKAYIVEHFNGYGEYRSITNHVAEFVLAEDAQAVHARLQCEDAHTVHVSSVFSEQKENSCFKNINLQFGGKVSRNEIYPSIPASNSEAWLIGTNVLNNDQHVDNFTVIDHIAPHCESHELYKGIYADRSKGVFSGTIIVQREAQKTNAYQSNASLLLSGDAESSSKPQLKIWADDVKCSHGATIGQLDDQALFYLRARGIPEKEARAMLTRAYISEVFTHLEDETFKSSVEEVLNKKLDSMLG